MRKNFKKELEKIVSGISWNFIGILDTDKKLHPIPKNIQINTTDPKERRMEFVLIIAEI